MPAHWHLQEALVKVILWSCRYQKRSSHGAARAPSTGRLIGGSFVESSWRRVTSPTLGFVYRRPSTIPRPVPENGSKTRRANSFYLLGLSYQVLPRSSSPLLWLIPADERGKQRDPNQGLSRRRTQTAPSIGIVKPAVVLAANTVVSCPRFILLADIFISVPVSY